MCMPITLNDALYGSVEILITLIAVWLASHSASYVYVYNYTEADDMNVSLDG